MQMRTRTMNNNILRHDESEETRLLMLAVLEMNDDLDFLIDGNYQEMTTTGHIADALYDLYRITTKQDLLDELQLIYQNRFEDARKEMMKSEKSGLSS